MLSQVARSNARARAWIGSWNWGVAGGVVSERWDTAEIGVAGATIEDVEARLPEAAVVTLINERWRSEEILTGPATSR